MPLPQQKLAALRNTCQQNAGNYDGVDLALLIPNLPANECACWRWASSGLTLPVKNDPAQAFSAIAVGPTGLNTGSAWDTANVRDWVNGVHNQFNQFQQNGFQNIGALTYQTWFQQTVNSVTSATARLGGMTPGAGAHANGERYYIVMHYERTTAGTNNAPNYTHWWLKIDLGGGNYCCIEMFPRSTQLTFRYNSAYALNDNVEIEVTDFAAGHLTVLNAIL